ncbi:ATP-binding protein [Olsenella intestinalis]|uniref:ATP-binding protein n=1 Tax=Olsenella intestinalis TaxID=2930083 RepID=UPI00200EF9BA|nr:MoxR family ATPase [Olsenella intestinalis]
MNIKDATEQIEGAIRAYLSRDEHGLLRIPFRMQRPIIMLGPPGVGKTAVVAQIAEELDINFVSYSITHHTRQSALGLPFIAQEEFEGESYSVSEYTMSEIIAAVYRAREASGVAEGILFLDEVNCVSETLAPAMLQFLQYKTFGMHRMPEGWAIVCAGNPPEYNRAAREFDPAMLDRLMRIDVDPNLQVWQEYAAAHGVHPAVTTYLDAKPGSFYKVRAAARGSKIVTSRGWEDLSRMLQAYEAEGMVPPASLPGRYLQDPEVSEDFGVYYELFRKYEDDYKVTDILAGRAGAEIAKRAAAAPFDERVALVGLLLDAMLERAHGAIELEEALRLARKDLLDMKGALGRSESPVEVVDRRVAAVSSEGTVGKKVRGQVGDRSVIKAERLRVLRGVRAAVARGAAEGKGSFDAAKASFNAECKAQAQLVKEATAALDAGFLFLDGAFGKDSQESLIYVTKLSADPVLIRLVSEHGSKEFMKHNKSLLFTERGLGLLEEIKALEE